VELPRGVGKARGQAARLTTGERAERLPTSLPTGALMFEVVRHNLQGIARLAVLLVLLGLGTVPVECAAVYGPHSVFVSAESVAALRSPAAGSDAQAETSPHMHLAGPATPGASHMAAHAATDSSRTPDSTAPQGGEQGARAGVPATAGAMTDALIALALIASPAGISAEVPQPLPLPAAQPVRHLLPAPEPPPP
jgi:hypothetical protein